MPNTLIEKLTNIKTAKENLKTALEGMGLNPGNDFSSYANFAQEQLQPAGGNGIKLFSTIEEMNADSNPHEGDLAIVYRSEIQNMTADMEVTSITFPETVTLPVAFTDNTYCRLRAVDSSIMFDGDCQLDQNSFRFNSWSESGMVSVEYTSTDGITYTRTRIRGDNGNLTNPVELHTTCKVEVEGEGEWNDNLGYFMQIGGMNFEGLFQYLNVDTNNQLTFNLSSLNISDTTINLVQAGPILNYEILKSAAKYLSQFYTASEFQFDAYIDYDNKVHIIYAKSRNDSLTRMFIVNKNSPEIYMGPNGRTVAEHFDAIYDDVEKTFKNEQSIAFTTMFKNVSSSGVNCVKINGYPICPIGIKQNNYDEWRHFNSTIYYLDTIDSNTNINITDDNLKLNEMVTKYVTAPTQLTLNDPNQILPGLIGYGKNGVVVGDNTIYNNLKTELISDSLCGNNNLNDLYYYENIPSKSQEARYNLLKNKIIKFNKSTSQTDKKIGILKEHINLQGTSSYNRFIVDGLSIGLVFTRGDNNYEVVILDNNGQTHYLYDEMPENCGGILRAWYYNNHIYIIFSDKTNASIYKLYKCTNTDDIEMITEIICPDTVAYFIDNSIFYINNGTSGQGSRKLYKFDLINELSSSVDLPFSVSSSHYLSRIGNVLTMCVYKLNDTFNKQTTLLQWNTNLELITNQEYTTNNTSNYIYNEYNVMAFRLNNKLYFSQYGYIYEADEINHTYNYVGVGENKSSGMDFVWASDNESLYTQELFTLFNYNEKNNITINDIWRLNNFALLTYYDNNFVEIVELIDVDQINNISNNGDIVTIIFNEKNNICTINPIGKIINIIE